MTVRLTSALLAFAMLHLDVARAEASCIMHGDEAPSASHEGMQHGADAPADSESCDEPLSGDCCLALLSCAPILGPGEARAIAEPALVHATVAAAVIERPLAPSTAPEPPPPKA